MKKLCVGIDVAKNKFDVCFTVDGEKYFGYTVFQNSKHGLKDLVTLAKKYKREFKTDKIHFCMEATGIYHYELCEYLQKYSALIVSVVNPYQTKSFAKSLLLRTKTDKVDSKMLAQYCFRNNPKVTPPISEKIKKLRSLVRLQESEIKKRTEEKNRLHAACDEYVREMISENISFIDNQIKSIEEKIMEVINSDEKLKNDFKLLLTVPCIGEKLAWIILSEYYYIEPSEIRPKSCVAHAGLSPRACDSGDRAYGKPHISRIGVSRIRSNLYMPSLIPANRENYFTSFYNRLVKRGKLKKVAITAVSRKILLTAMGVLKNQKPFDSNWADKTREEYEKNLKVA